MPYFLKKIFFFFVLSHIITPSYANQWPVFFTPDKAFLLNHHYIDTVHCPPGEGKLIPNSHVNIKKNLCQTFCPEEWNWISSSDQACHPIETDFSLQQLEFIYFPDEENTTSHSLAIASYGKKNEKTIFKFVMQTDVNQHWYCIETTPGSSVVTCANDV